MRPSPLAKVGKKKRAANEAAGITQYSTIPARTAPVNREGIDLRGGWSRVTSRPSPERRALTARIKARDLNTCQKCGGQGTEVHHLFKVGSHKELELIDANCVLLCAWCHRINPDAAHKGNETAFRHWRARTYAPFAAIFQADIDRPTLNAANSLSEGGAE